MLAVDHISDKLCNLMLIFSKAFLKIYEFLYMLAAFGEGREIEPPGEMVHLYQGITVAIIPIQNQFNFLAIV